MPDREAPTGDKSAPLDHADLLTRVRGSLLPAASALVVTVALIAGWWIRPENQAVLRFAFDPQRWPESPLPGLGVCLVGGALAAAAGSRRRASRLAAWAAIAVAGAVAVALHAASVAAALSVCIASWLSGAGALTVALRRRIRGVDEHLIAFALGLGLVASAVTALGFAGLLSRPWLASSLAALAGFPLSLPDVRAAIATALRSFRRKLALGPGEGAADVGPDRLGRGLRLLIGACLTFVLIEALVPEIQFDSLVYHLAMPQEYLRLGRVTDAGWQFRSYWPALDQMLWTPAFAFGGGIAAKLVSLAAGLAGIFAAAELAAAMSSDKVARPLAQALLLASPVVLWGLPTTYNDLLVGTFLFLGIWAAWRAASGEGSAWIVVSGLLLGFALSTKLSAAIWVAPAAVVGMVAVARRRVRLPDLGAALALAAVVGLPWYVRSLVLTGSPVFPWLNGVFRSPGWAPVNSALDLDTVGFGGLKALPSVLWDLATRPEATRGNVGLAWIALIPAALLATERRHLWLAGAGLCGLVGWAAGGEIARYLYPSILLFVPWIAAAVTAPPGLGVRFGRASLAAALALALLFPLASIPREYWNVLDLVPLRAALRLQAANEFLDGSVGGYPALAWLAGNRRTSRTFMMAAAFSLYSHSPLWNKLSSDLHRLADSRGRPGGVPKNASEAWRGGFRCLVVDHGSTTRAAFAAFASSGRLRRVFLCRRVAVYDILQPAP